MPLEIILEYRKGVLFIRLNGSLNKNTSKKLIRKIAMLEENAFFNIVINIRNVKNIDLKGINALYYVYEFVNKHNGQIMICGLNNIKIINILKKKRILNYIKQINNELEAFKLIKI